MPTTGSSRLHGLEPFGSAVEAAQLAHEQTGHGGEDTSGQGQQQGQGQRQGPEVVRENPVDISLLNLQACYEGIRLANIDNWCYINSAFLATTWALLNTASFTLNSWGPHASQLIRFLHNNTGEPLNLTDIPCFRFVFATWTNQNGQGDPVEFVAHMLRGMEFTNFDMRWDTRVQIGSLIHTHDCNLDPCTPLTLQFDPAHLDDTHVHLKQMIFDWSNQHGRQVGMITAPPLLCLQIDRCVVAGDGTIQKKDIAVQVHGGCDLPIFAGTDLQIVWTEYHVIAQIAHLGQDNAGHCRSMLITAPTIHGQEKTLALLTEDWVTPERISKAPYWFSRSVTCLWLCRSDQLKLYQVPAVIPTPIAKQTDQAIQTCLAHLPRGTIAAES